MSRRDDFQLLMEQNLARWSARFETVKTRLGTQSSADGRAADETKLGQLHAHAAAAVARLDALKGLRGDHWDVRKLEMARVWHDLDVLMVRVEEAVRAFDAEGAASRP